MNSLNALYYIIYISCETFVIMVLNLDDNDADEEEVVISKMSERQRRVNELLAEKESSSAAMELGSSSAAHNNNNNKKLQHNAKERIRRMRLNASYLALRALLPDISRRSKVPTYILFILYASPLIKHIIYIYISFDKFIKFKKSLLF